MVETKKGIKPQFIVVIVLIIVVLGISLVYAVYQSSLNKEKQVKIEELQKKVNSLTDSIESLQTNGSQVATQEQNQLQSIIGPWPEYTNEIIGFSLILPETWEGYLLTEGNGFVDFGFEEQNPVARINVIGHEQWEQIRQQGNQGLVYVGETEDFVIIYSLAAQAANEDIKSLILEFPEIVSTLTMLEGELTIIDYSGDVLAEEDLDEEDLDVGDEGYEEDLDIPVEDPELDPSLE
jgi:FtsZ-binding cell division protein ZapB